MALKQKIKNWDFPSNPTEEKGLCWRWTKDGLDFLSEYIQELIDHRDNEWLEAIGKKENWGENTDWEEVIERESRNHFRSEILKKMGAKK